MTGKMGGVVAGAAAGAKMGGITGAIGGAHECARRERIHLSKKKSERYESQSL